MAEFFFIVIIFCNFIDPRFFSNLLVSQNTENSLVKIHDRVVVFLVPVHGGVGVEADDQVVAKLGNLKA